MGNKWWAPPPFIVNGIAAAAQVDPWVKEFIVSHPDYTVLTNESIKRWFEKSSIPKNVLGDQGRCVGQIRRQRNFLVALSPHQFHGVMEKDRKQMVARFPGYKKTAMVMMTPPEKSIGKFADVSFPEEADGFDSISYIIPKEETEEKLKVW